MAIAMSFFAKQPKRIGPDRHWHRISSLIRGNQIAEYIGAKLNPESGYANDVCIYVKPHVKPGNDFDFEGRKPYLDICDAPDLYYLARMHPEVPVIAASDYNFELLKRILPNNVINIPEQHCNFERLRRTREEVTTVGIIGTLSAFTFLPEGLKDRLAERGMNLIEYSKFSTRQDVIDFYMSIDVQIIWRPYYRYDRDILANPLKIVNASSFGIPTIAYDEPCFEEMDGCYKGVHNLDEFLEELDKLRADPKLYERYAKRCIEKSEDYHIEKIADQYKSLLELEVDSVEPLSSYEFILKKYGINVGRQYVIEIPNMDRHDLAKLFAELKFTKGAEIGVAKGDYSKMLCQANPKLHLYSVDPWSPSAYEPGTEVDADQEFFNREYEAAKNRLASYNCTIIRKTSMDALADFRDGSLDFVYIDGNHDFVNVTNDIHYWLKKIRSGGIISGHDYAFFGIHKFNHVRRVLDAYIRSYRIIPLFVVGATAKQPGVKRDAYRSWFWVKT